MRLPSLKVVRRWWQIKTGRFDTPLDGDVPFWVLSLCIQFIVIGLLAKLILPDEDHRRQVVVVAEELEIDEVIQEIVPEVEFNDIDLDELNNDSDEQLEIAAHQETPLVEISVAPPLEIEVEPHDFGEIATDTVLTLEPTKLLSRVNTTGSIGNVVTGATGAVDQLTQEIMDSLEDNKTMLVWLFDQSASLTRQREEIEGRIDRIYRELNLLQEANSVAFKKEKEDDIPLLTQVYAFGRNVGPVMKKPTDNTDEIREAIRGIPRDTSGIENVFSAVTRCVSDFSSYRKVNRVTGARKRNVIIVILSDEAGDDGARADQAIQACQKFSIPVYVIGVPAPFGRHETRVKWVDPDPQYDQREQVARVSQGPESLLPERLQLNFMDRNFDDLDMIDSGFGPFHLTRLCYQTGGSYFAVHPNRRKGRVSYRETSVYSSDLRYFFTPEVMKHYQPDYVSVREYKKRVEASRSRMALVEAASVPEIDQLAAPRFRFTKFDEARFVNLVSQAQRASAILQPRLDHLYNILKEGERDREKEASLRWQAGYDLALGRVIAARLRAKSYNELLALAKTKLTFEDPKNNTWVLRASDNLSATGSQNEKLAAKARKYLNRVVEDHPDTPWALLAKRELSTPFGWEWKETYTEPPKPRPRRTVNNNNNNVPRNPQPRENAMPKKLRPIPRL